MYRGGYAPITCLPTADYIITKVKQSRLHIYYIEVKIHCDMRYTIDKTAMRADRGAVPALVYSRGLNRFNTPAVKPKSEYQGGRQHLRFLSHAEAKKAWMLGNRGSFSGICSFL